MNGDNNVAQILLYTDKAEIDEATLAALRDIGVFPVKVADENAVRLIPIPQRVDAEHVPVMLRVALGLMARNPQGSFAQNYGGALAMALTAADQKP